MYLCTHKCLYMYMCPVCTHKHTHTHTHTHTFSLPLTHTYIHTYKQNMTCARSYSAPPSIVYIGGDCGWPPGKLPFQLVLLLIGCPQCSLHVYVCVCECVTIRYCVNAAVYICVFKSIVWNRSKKKRAEKFGEFGSEGCQVIFTRTVRLQFQILYDWREISSWEDYWSIPRQLQHRETFDKPCKFVDSAEYSLVPLFHFFR